MFGFIIIILPSISSLYLTIPQVPLLFTWNPNVSGPTCSTIRAKRWKEYSRHIRSSQQEVWEESISIQQIHWDQRAMGLPWQTGQGPGLSTWSIFSFTP